SSRRRHTRFSRDWSSDVCSSDLPAWALMWFTCDQVGVWNWERWCSPEFDALLAEGAKEMDPAKREPIYRRMQDLMEESGAYVFEIGSASCRERVLILSFDKIS